MGNPQSGVAGQSVSDRETRWRRYISEICAGSADALDRLYGETVSTIYGLALGMVGNPADAEEVVLDVFEQIWRTARSFDGGRGTVWGWLALMTRSRAVDRLRASVRCSGEDLARLGYVGVATHDLPPDEATLLDQRQSLVRRALTTLPREQRQALEMAYFSELTHVEIAAELGVPLGTIKTRIRMAMEKLRDALGQGPRATAGFSR